MISQKHCCVDFSTNTSSWQKMLVVGSFLSDVRHSNQSSLQKVSVTNYNRMLGVITIRPREAFWDHDEATFSSEPTFTQTLFLRLSHRIWVWNLKNDARAIENWFLRKVSNISKIPYMLSFKMVFWIAKQILRTI